MTATPRVWLVTGSSSGLGLNIVRHVLEKGDIAVATLRKPEVLADLAAQYPADRLLLLKLDVTIPEDIVAAFKKAKEVFGRLDVVVSNAAYGILGEVEGTPDDVARPMFDTNFWGSAHIIQEAVKFFRDVNEPGRGGRVIQISSAVGVVGWPGSGFYSASKHAIEGLTESLAKELDPAWNIKITIVPLGAFVTNALPALVKLPQHPAYTSPDLPSVISRRYLLAGAAGEKDPAFEINGDPAKAAQALYRLRELSSPPLRLMLGKESVAGVKEKAKLLLDETDQYASWSEGLDRD